MTSAGSEEMFEGAFADIVSSVQRKGEQGAPLAWRKFLNLKSISDIQHGFCQGRKGKINPKWHFERSRLPV